MSGGSDRKSCIVLVHSVGQNPPQVGVRVPGMVDGLSGGLVG